MLKIYDTNTRKLVDFKPLNEKHIKLYVCGPTVYDNIHIGNARPIVIFDVLYRLLSNLYPKVTYVRNITDIDDKINARAKENGETITELTARTEARFLKDADALGALAPTIQPRATEHIPEMILMIEDLIQKGHAYAKDGHALFSVKSWDAYGKFAKKEQIEQIAGSRVEIAEYKNDPADFVLWKPSLDDEPGWESPWGRGRPGWHIECSAMCKKHLGENFDIHGGGLDLIFPHHQNEIAQSCCANENSTFATYWMHNGFLMSEGQKMSKSAGNFYTINELLKEFSGGAIRLALLSTQYTKPLDFTKDKLEENQKLIARIRDTLVDFAQYKSKPRNLDYVNNALHKFKKITVHIEYSLKDFNSIQANKEAPHSTYDNLNKLAHLLNNSNAPLSDFADKYADTNHFNALGEQFQKINKAMTDIEWSMDEAFEVDERSEVVQEKLVEIQDLIKIIHDVLVEFDEYRAEVVIEDDALLTALKDDLNTPLALTRLWELRKDLITEPSAQLYSKFVSSLNVLGLMPTTLSEDTTAIEELADKRLVAKAEKDFATADALRTEIKALGYEVLDSSDGYKLRKV